MLLHLPQNLWGLIIKCFLDEINKCLGSQVIVHGEHSHLWLGVIHFAHSPCKGKSGLEWGEQALRVTMTSL